MVPWGWSDKGPEGRGQGAALGPKWPAAGTQLQSPGWTSISLPGPPVTYPNLSTH